MTFFGKLHGCVKLTAAVGALVLCAGPGLAESLKDTGTTRSRQAIELYKSISKPEPAARPQKSAKKQAPAQTSAALQPLAAPNNDDFADAIALEGRSGTVSGTNVDATSETGEPAHAGVAGISSVWYTFTPNQTGVTFIDTFGSDFDTALAVYTGNRVDNLVEVASNDDAGGTLQSQVVFLAEAGTTYRIAVDGFLGEQGNFTLNFERTDQLAPENDDFADAIALQGRSGSVDGNNIGATVEPGEPAHAGFGGVSSVWYTFTPNQSGVTPLDVFSDAFSPVLAVYTGNSVNALTEVASGPFGSLAFFAEAGVTYRIAVDGNSTLPPTQGTFTLFFERTDQQPSPNDDFADAIALDGQSGSVDGNNIGATAEPGEPAHAGVAGISSVWYSFTANQTGVTFIDTFIADFDTVLAVYTGNQADNLVEVASNDDAGGSLQSQVIFLAEAGTTYRIAVDGFGGEQGVFTLSFERTDQLPSPNDDFADAIALDGRSGSVDGNNLFATAEPGEPVHAGVGAGSSVWYSFTPNQSGVATLTATVPGSEFSPVLAVYEGSSVDALDEVASGIAFFGARELAFFAEAGTTYRIAVDADATGGGGQGVFTLDFRRNNQTPPANDDFVDAIALDGRRGSVSGNSRQATREGGEPAHFASFAGATRSLWYSFTPNRTGVALFDSFGSEFDSVLSVYSGDDLGSLVEVATNDDTASQENNFAPFGVQSEVAFLAERGVTYHVAVDGFGGARGPVTLNFRQTSRSAPANDAFANPRVIGGESGVDGGFSVGASAEPGEPNHAGVSGPSSSAWWRWRAPFTDQVTFTTAGSNFDTVLAVYQGDAVSNLTEIASNDDVVPERPGDPDILESLVTFSAQEGEVYRIAVDGFAGDEGSITLAFTRGDAPLKIARGPGK